MTKLAIVARTCLGIIAMICVTQLSARSQNQKVTLKVSGQSLQYLFKEIKKQTGLVVFYSDALLNDQEKVSVTANDETISSVMEKIVAGRQLRYEIQEKYIVISAKNKVADTKGTNLPDNTLPPAKIDVKGTVKNDRGEVVVGASVFIKGTNWGTSTDGSGAFLLKGIDEKATLVVSGVNIETVEMQVNNRSELVIIAKIKVTALADVEVVNKGYYEESKRLSTSNVGRVTAKEIESQPVSNPLLTLQGRVPGLVVTQSNGVPGGGVTVRIQGPNNLISGITGSDPLILVDGVPYPSQNLRSFSGGLPSFTNASGSILGNSSGNAASDQGTQGSPLSYLNPSDIESIDILKDADATAIYGSRAANGAILITTKRGKPGKMKVDLNMQTGWGKVARKLDLLNSQQYMEMRREAKRNDNAPIAADDYDLRGLWDTTRYTDWQKELIGGTAKFIRAVLGISGGNVNSSYLVSGTYSKETSVFPGQFSNPKASLYFSLNASDNKQKFRFQFSGTFVDDQNKLPSADFTQRALTFAPVAPPIYNADGTLNWAVDPLTGNSTWANPMAFKYALLEISTTNILGNGLLSYKLMPGLEIRSSFGYNLLLSNQFNAKLDESFSPEERIGRVRSVVFSSNSIKSWIAEPQISWNKKIEKTKLDVLVGGTIQQQKSDGFNLYAQGQGSDAQLRSLNAATSFFPNITDLSVYKYMGIFGRLNLNFNDRYIFNFSGRRDGSSRFGPANRFNNFYSIGAGWILSDEKWISENLRFINFAKLRGSYGTTGNDQIGNYQYMGLFSPASSPIPYQERAALGVNRLSNPNLEWEENRKLQAGIDLRFFKDKLSISVNYVRNRSSNSLTQTSLPTITGFGNVLENLDALIENRNWEFSLFASPIKRVEFSWTTSFNLTLPRNKLISFPNLNTSAYSTIYRIGQPIRITPLSDRFVGVNPLTGLYTYVPEVGFFTQLERYYGGFVNDFTYKNVRLSIVAEFKGQNAFANLGGIATPGRFSSIAGIGNTLAEAMNRWTKPGDIATYQRFNSTGAVSPYSSDRNLIDASYLRLKNVSLSYDIPKLILDKYRIQNARFFINGQNLFTVTKYRLLDPETLSLISLPPLRTITVGMQIIL